MADPTVAVLLEKLGRSRARVVETVRSMPEEERGAAPAPGEWSAHQQIAHLAEMEPVWLGWALQIARRPGAVVGEPGLTLTPSVATAGAEQLETLLQRLERSRE